MMKYSAYTWDLVRALESASPASCKTPATLILSTQTINQKKEKNQKGDSTPDKSYHTAVFYVDRTQS